MQPDEPQIVSLWRSRDKRREDYLCAGLRLDDRHILTVRHAFEPWPEGQPIIVHLLRNRHESKQARLLHRHAELDAAVLALDSPDGSVPPPPLCRTGFKVAGTKAVLRVVDPTEFNAHPLSNYNIGFDADRDSEYILSPDNAKGHSGGVVEVEGAIVGLLSRRAKDNPLCRAVAMHRLWPWIEGVLREQEAGAPRAPEPPPEPVVVSPAYRQLVELVRQNVREILQAPELELLRRNWSDDPIRGFDAENAPEQVIAQVYQLHNATKETVAVWRADAAAAADPVRASRKEACRKLITELVKLAVDPGLDQAAEALANSPPARLKIASRYPVGGEIAYFAFGNLVQQLKLCPDGIGVQSADSVYFATEIAGGQGPDQYQELLRKLWVRVMDEPDPGYLDDDRIDRLMGCIYHFAHRDRRRFLIVLTPEHQAFPAVLDAQWKGPVKPGILDHERSGQCSCLLAQETLLFPLAHDYLRLLEGL